MSGVKTKRVIWTVVFLGVTLAAIVMEVVAGVWHPAGTIPWTEYLAQYVPWPIQLAAYVVLAVWLPFHFWRADAKRKAAYRVGRADAIVEAAFGSTSAVRAQLGLATTQAMLEELHARGVSEVAAWGGTSGEHLRDDAEHLLKILTPATLAYRTVDGR